MAGSAMAMLLVDRETTQTRYCYCSSNTVPKSSYEVNCMCWPREIPVLASWHIRSLRHLMTSSSHRREVLVVGLTVSHHSPPKKCHKHIKATCS
jgi:hypothetical protein